MYCSDISLNKQDTEIYSLLKEHMANTVKWSAYNWVRPSLWTAMFQHAAGSAGTKAVAKKKML